MDKSIVYVTRPLPGNAIDRLGAAYTTVIVGEGDMQPSRETLLNHLAQADGG